MKTQVVPTVSLSDSRRGRRGWSQRDLAAASGVPAGTIAQAEAGRLVLPPRHRVAIARALGLTEDDARRVKELA
jgi:transcriptional regulator with XRE-family HTH domain